MFTGDHKTDTAGFYDFKVLLFLPGMSPAGVRGRLAFKDGVLEFNAPGVWITLLADQVGLRSGGYDGRQWLLAWQTEAGRATAMLTGVADMHAMRHLAPPSLARQLDQALRAVRARERRFRWWLGALLIVFLLSFLALGLFWLNSERIAGWVASRISLQDEQRLGRLAFDQMRPQSQAARDGARLAHGAPTRRTSDTGFTL